MRREWIEERMTYIACGLTAIAIVLWSWWVISYMNDWARTINRYIIQTDGRLEQIEINIERLNHHHHESAPVERNA